MQGLCHSAVRFHARIMSSVHAANLPCPLSGTGSWPSHREMHSTAVETPFISLALRPRQSLPPTGGGTIGHEDRLSPLLKEML